MNPKVIAFTPAGRKRYIEILLPYVADLHKKGVIDQWVLFENTINDEDKRYLEEVERNHDFITTFHVNDSAPRDGFRIHAFYKLFTDADAVYLRLDDDICYIAPDAIQKLIQYRLEHPEPFLVYPNIINNTRMAYRQQQQGRIPDAEHWGKVDDDILTANPYTNPEFTAKLHQLALERINTGKIGDFAIENELIESYDRGHVSVNSFALLGKDMIELKDLIGYDEERYLSQYRPGDLKRFNGICGDAIVVHFAYHTQREELEKTDLLNQYKLLSEKL